MNPFVQKFLTFDKKLIHGAAVGIVASAGYLAAHPQLVQKIASAVAAYPTTGITGVATAVLVALYSQAKS